MIASANNIKHRSPQIIIFEVCLPLSILLIKPYRLHEQFLTVLLHSKWLDKLLLAEKSNGR